MFPCVSSHPSSSLWSFRASVPTLVFSLALLALHIDVSCGQELRGATQAIKQPRDLLTHIVTVLGDLHGGKELLYSSFKDLPALEAQLRPMIAALPDNGQGKLGATGIRFALHRLFVERHGWYVEGLYPDGQAWNGYSPSQIAILQKMPLTVRNLLQDRLDQQGLDLQDIAVLGATIEYLVHKEATDRLRAIYITLGMPLDNTQAHSVIQTAIDAYMGSYILGVDPRTLNHTGLSDLLQKMPGKQMQPSWFETQRFVDGYMEKESQFGYLNFAHVAHAMEAVGESYGRWQNKVCLKIKDHLLELEDRDTGRVFLSDFYDAALNKGRWDFTESMAYLRAMGAVDDSIRGNPRVIIPNYINTPSNCLASSSFYSVCCINECEKIRGELERGLRAPEATPLDIVNLVAKIPSSTVPKDRTLSALMRHRLGDIAARHGGKVPLSSRLFAQWLHHAYPRECPYPYVAGEKNALSLQEWGLGNPENRAIATDEEMQRIAKVPKPRSSAPIVYAKWTNEEELVIPHQSHLGFFWGGLTSWVDIFLSSLQKFMGDALGKWSVA